MTQPLKNIIFSDVDGTAVDGDVLSNPQLCGALAQMSVNGGLIPATGRHFYKFEDSLTKVFSTKSGIFANGGLVMYQSPITEKSTLVHTSTFGNQGSEALHAVIYDMKKEDLPLNCITYTRGTKERLQRQLFNITTGEQFCDDNIVYITGLNTAQNGIREVLKTMLSNYQDVLNYTINGDSILINPYGVNKATGLEKMFGYMDDKKIIDDNTEIVIAGNDYNDESMLHYQDPRIVERIIVGKILSSDNFINIHTPLFLVGHIIKFAGEIVVGLGDALLGINGESNQKEDNSIEF